MRLLRFLLLIPGLLLAAGATASFGQTIPASPVPPASPDAPTSLAAEAPGKWLLKVGLNAGRAFRYSGYQGVAVRLPVSVGAEYALSSRFTLYGQLDSDFRLGRQNTYYGDQNFAIPAGALGVGVRYYYNQAGRARHNRAHGPFVGNYLAVEAHTEVRQRYRLRDEIAPGLNLVWGLQRRLGRNFLFDFNAGVGAGPNRSNVSFGSSPGPVTITTQFNLGICFGH